MMSWSAFCSVIALNTVYAGHERPKHRLILECR